jgi:uncharacterized surface protein with fasciclin (FAS1) repeats
VSILSNTVNLKYSGIRSELFETLLLEENADALTELLTNHTAKGTIIVPGDGTKGLVTTPSGEKLDISTKNGVMVN